jgi:hypothetical protein
MALDPAQKWSHRIARVPSNAGIITGEAQDIAYSQLTPGLPLNFSGQYVTTDPILGQFVGTNPVMGAAQAAFEAQLGRKLDSLLVFGDPTNLGSGFAVNQQPGARVVVAQPLIATGWDMQATGTGAHDSVYIAAAAQLAAVQSRIVAVRLGWEFNLNGAYPWCAGGAGTNQTPTNYIACFQRFVDYIRLACPGLPIVWNPNFDSDPTSWYPGDNYVDCVAIDCYMNSSFYSDSWGNMYVAPAGFRWLDGFTSLHGKMVALGEWATNYNSGNYITPMAQWLRRPRANKVLFHNYWNSDASFNGNLDNYPIAKAAYIAAFGDQGSIYVGAP